MVRGYLHREEGLCLCGAGEGHPIREGQSQTSEYQKERQEGCYSTFQIRLFNMGPFIFHDNTLSMSIQIKGYRLLISTPTR